MTAAHADLRHHRRLRQRRDRLRRWAAVAALLTVGSLPWAPDVASAAAPGVVAEADSRAVRSVVESQLAALARGDADGAYRHATDAIRAQFGNAANFIAMVQSAYPMLVRPAATGWLAARPADGGGVVQPVQVRDRESRLWLANYLLERQPDGGWRIAGCVVVAASSGIST